MAVPVAGSVKRMFAARTSAQDRAAREQHTQEAAQRAQALRESVEKENAPEGRTGAGTMPKGYATTIMFKGVIKTRGEWAEVFGLSANTVSTRVARGTPLDAPMTAGSNRHAGTWNYTADCAIERVPTSPAAANAGARLAAEIHRDAKPAKQAKVRAPFRASSPAALEWEPASEATVVAVLVSLGWTARRDPMLRDGVLLAAPGSAP